MDDMVNPFAHPSDEPSASKHDSLVEALESLNEQDEKIKIEAAKALPAVESYTESEVKMIAVEGPGYKSKLKRIESILRRQGLQPIAGMLRDIDTVIKE